MLPTPPSAPSPPALTPLTAPPAPPAPTAPPTPPIAAPSPVAPSPTEIELLADAQRALQAGAPARVLALTDTHRARYPDGQMIQEREALAIQALAQLGRTDLARARLHQFVTAFPGSGYRARLERLLAAAAPR